MKTNNKEILLYGFNGIAATAVHYTVLRINLEILDLKSAGIANMVAACFGITASFLGNRFYVFKQTNVNISKQAIKFSSLYAIIALLHGLILWFWTDRYGLDYRYGFIIATGMQVFLSYIGNKFVVFKK